MDLLLPPIDLETLPEETRTWLLAKSAQLGCDPVEVIRQELDTAAGLDGFAPKRDRAA
jgi:hypothetical protein